MNRFAFEGWHLIGRFPEGYGDGVGSWLLHHGGEALLLECPPGLTVGRVKDALAAVGARLFYAAASHSHGDHLSTRGWTELRQSFPDCEFLHPSAVRRDRLLRPGGEPLWLLTAPKHSADDVVTVFRGVAMTGDIELGMLASVNREVPAGVKRASMARLAGFPARAGYHVHTTVSAHLNDVRRGADWPTLFEARE